MSTYRIYVDSRDRQSGTAEDFTYALPYTVNITEKSLANIDAVVIPNSIQTVIPGKNDLIYFRENSQLDQSYQKIARLNPGYYNIESLATEIARAMTEVSFMPGVGPNPGYAVNYNSRLGRYEFGNPAQRFGFFFLIYSKETQEIGAANNISTVPRIIENGNGAWRLLGLMTGPDILVVGDGDEIPGVAPNAPMLQYATQLFIKTSLGISGRSVGAKGNMSISRRVILEAPQFALNVDRHATSWDSFQISAGTLISTFTVTLTDYNNNVIDLNGQDWSFSITIFRED